MSLKNIFQVFKNYKKARAHKRQSYLKKFEEKMIYRTTKTENPETTPSLVKDILHKFKQA